MSSPELIVKGVLDPSERSAEAGQPSQHRPHRPIRIASALLLPLDRSALISRTPLDVPSCSFDFLMTNPPFFDSHGQHRPHNNPRRVHHPTAPTASAIAIALLLSSAPVRVCCAVVLCVQRSECTASEWSCEGGEEAFIGRLLADSVAFRSNCQWFTVRTACTRRET